MIDPMIDIYWNEKFPDSIYVLRPDGFFCIGAKLHGEGVVKKWATLWDVTRLKEDGFERVGEL